MTPERCKQSMIGKNTIWQNYGVHKCRNFTNIRTVYGTQEASHISSNEYRPNHIIGVLCDDICTITLDKQYI